jgi:cell division protein FtsB
LNKAVNSYWADTRLSTQRPAARVVTLPTHTRGMSEEVSGLDASRDVARAGRFSIPSWVFFCMIVLATFAVCATVTMRTHAEMRSAEHRFESMSTEVEHMRDTNESLKREVERMRSDPRAIETAARTRLNMVRTNEVVVPLN